MIACIPGSLFVLGRSCLNQPNKLVYYYVSMLQNRNIFGGLSCKCWMPLVWSPRNKLGVNRDNGVGLGQSCPDVSQNS